MNETRSPAQIVEPVEVILTEGATVGFTTIVIPADVAVVGAAHAALEVKTTVTISPFAKVVVVNVDEVAPPMFVPFTCHWYVGPAPPFVGVAVNVTDVPAHIGPEGTAAIVTEGTTTALIIIFTKDLPLIHLLVKVVK